MPRCRIRDAGRSRVESEASSSSYLTDFGEVREDDSEDDLTEPDRAGEDGSSSLLRKPKPKYTSNGKDNVIQVAVGPFTRILQMMLMRTCRTSPRITASPTKRRNYGSD